MKKSVLIIGLLGLSFIAKSQINLDFSWTPNSTAPTTISNSPANTGCQNLSVVSTLTTSVNHSRNFNGATAVSAGNPITSALIPATGVAGNAITCTITFNTPVANVRLLVRDLDNDGTTVLAEETITGLSANLSPASATVNFSATNVAGSVNVAGTTVTPQLNNSRFWLNINTAGLVNSVTFTYNRPNTTYAILFDSLAYDCPPQACPCPTSASIATGSVMIGNNGVSSATIQMNSGTMAVRTVRVSLVNYTQNVAADCRKCDPASSAVEGTVTGSGTIFGIPGVLTGSNTHEVIWTLPNPQIINQNVNLNLLFPDVLALSCCQNKIDFCIRVDFIGADCNLCSHLLCTIPQAPGAKTVQSDNGFSMDPAVSGTSAPEEQKLNLYPNPTQGSVTIEMMEEVENSQLEILDVNGKIVYTRNITGKVEVIDTSNLNNGIYIMKINNNGSMIQKRFVIQK